MGVNEPTALPGVITIGYGLPATLAVGGVPAVVSTTLVTVSLLTRPTWVKAVPAGVNVVP